MTVARFQINFSLSLHCCLEWAVPIAEALGDVVLVLTVLPICAQLRQLLVGHVTVPDRLVQLSFILL